MLFSPSLNRSKELSFEVEKKISYAQIVYEMEFSRIDAIWAVCDRYLHIMRVLTWLSLTSTNKVCKNIEMQKH